MLPPNRRQAAVNETVNWGKIGTTLGFKAGRPLYFASSLGLLLFSGKTQKYFKVNDLARICGTPGGPRRKFGASA
jgi:hypothetical protein